MEEENPPEVEVVEEAPQEPQLNGVLVQRHDSENGDFGVSMTTIGDCRKSEIITLLKIALKTAERELSGE